MKRGGRIARKRLCAKELPPARSLCQIAEDLPSQSWKKITGEGDSRASFFPLCSSNGLDGQRIGSRKDDEEPPQELLIEWPEGDKDPWKYWLSSLPPHRASSEGWSERRRDVSVLTGLRGDERESGVGPF